MKQKKVEETFADRRNFLKGSVVSVAAVGAVVAMSKGASAGHMEVSAGSGYRETDHVKTFYETARF